jgi:hypothetical protein
MALMRILGGRLARSGIILPDGSIAATTREPTPEERKNMRKFLAVLQAVQEHTETAQEALELLSACIIEYLNNAPAHVWPQYLEMVLENISAEVQSARGLKT